VNVFDAGKTKVIGIPDGEAVFIQYRNVTVRRTAGRTEYSYINIARHYIYNFIPPNGNNIKTTNNLTKHNK